MTYNFDFLLEKANVVGTPGSGFGPSGEAILPSDSIWKLREYAGKQSRELRIFN